MPQYDKLVAHINGSLAPLAEARVSVFDSALMFGDMVFEMTRSFQRRPFRLDRHLDRLYASLRLVDIDCGLSQEQMLRTTMETVEANLPFIEDDLDYYIMHDISRGPLSFYQRAFPGGLQPTLIIAIWPMIEHLARVATFYETGVHAVITSQQAIPSRYLDPKAKTRSRLHYQMANLQAARLGPDAYALMLDEHGRIVEGPGFNFFMVKDGTLYTSQPENILRGISRGMVFDLANELGIPCQAGNIEPFDALQADEAFLTATSYSILPVTRFEGRVLGDGAPGAITRRLLGAWSERVGVDIPTQARDVTRRYCEA